MNLKDPHNVVHTAQKGLENNRPFQMLKEAGFDLALVSSCGRSINAVTLTEEVVTCLECLART